MRHRRRRRRFSVVLPVAAALLSLVLLVAVLLALAPPDHTGPAVIGSFQAPSAGSSAGSIGSSPEPGIPSAASSNSPEPTHAAVPAVPAPAAAAPAAAAPPVAAPAAPTDPHADAVARILAASRRPWRDMPADLEGLIEDFAANQGPAGLAVALDTPAGRYLSLDGYADLTSGLDLTASDRSGFRSITKSFVGTVVLQLAAEGKLSLDDPVSRYVDGVPDTAITIRMALGMRTGLAEYSDTPGFSEQLNADFDHVWSDEELLGDAFDQPLVFAPGTRYGYSNTNTVLMGRVIEAVTGQSWDLQVKTRILDPLGLASVTYPGAESLSQDVAHPYQIGAAGIEAIDPGSPTLYSAAGGLFGTVGDLLTWGTALGSGALLPPAEEAERTADASDPLEDAGSPDYDSYGLALGSLDGWWGHTGTGLGYESLVMYNPATRDTVAILINTSLPSPDAAAQLFRELVPLLD